MFSEFRKQVEKEHTTNKEEAEGIALQHLAEKPDYYSKLKRMESTQSESTIVADLLKDNKFDFISEAKKMKKDPCWDGYGMIGTKKKSGKTVPTRVVWAKQYRPTVLRSVIYV